MAMNMKQQVTITCYGETETMTRKKALEKYFEGMLYCDGSEQERYTTIYLQLMEGLTNVTDEIY